MRSPQSFEESNQIKSFPKSDFFCDKYLFIFFLISLIAQGCAEAVANVRSSDCNSIEELAQSIDNVEDMARLLRDSIQYQLDEADRLYPADLTLERGFGDCDNKALVCQKIFEVKGQLLGHDYNPMVLGLGNHAVCVVEQFDGSIIAIDSGNVNEIGMNGDVDIFSASEKFKESDLKNYVFVRDLHQGEYDILKDYSVNAETLEKDYKVLKIKVYTSVDNTDLDIKDYLPEDFKQYEMLMFHVGDGEYAEDLVYFFMNGELVQVSQPDSVGMVHYYWPKTGVLKEVSFKPGNPVYEEEGVKSRLYDFTGELEKIVYVDGTVKWVSQDLKMPKVVEVPVE